MKRGARVPDGVPYQLISMLEAISAGVCWVWEQDYIYTAIVAVAWLSCLIAVGSCMCCWKCTNFKHIFTSGQ